MKSVLEVFLSSTSRDLKPHRDKVREMVERLGQTSICMETWGAQPSTPLATCRDRVQQTDALVVIVSHRYGWVPNERAGGDGKKSITWWEVYWAQEVGRPVYAYLVDRLAPWAGDKEQDRLLEAESEDARLEVARAVEGLLDFRRFLEARTTCDLFTSADDLGGKVATALANWLRHQRAQAVVPTSSHLAREADTAVAPLTPAWIGSPFPGLRAFTPADAPIFFGRDRETEFLLERLSNSSCRFLLVVGTSGSGKSSLVAAGLIPRLAANAIPGSEDWLLPEVRTIGDGHTWLGLRFTPGEQGADPFLALANKLAPMLSDQTPREVVQALDETPDALSTLIERLLERRPSRAEALLFVDQFEELVTVVADDGRRNRFMEMLVAATHCRRLRVVGTLRADFYHRCIEAQPVVAELLRDRGVTVPLGAPSVSALAEMVKGPATRSGLVFDDRLVDDLVDDTVSRPGGLALLAFALHELYDARTPDGRLTRHAFEQFAGLTGVINTRAESIFASLAASEQACLASVFRQLVTVDENNVATRSRARRDDVVASSPYSGKLVEAFERARLLVPDRAADGTTVLDVAHEALLREWPRLAAWVRERADDLRLMRQVEGAAREWERHDRTMHYVWPQERLGPVYEAIERLDIRDELSELVRSFIRPELERLVLELGDLNTTHPRRAAIGDRLDQLGDPRPGVGLTPNGTPDIVWCNIPGGTVQLEEVKGTFDVAPFHIAKYPTTYRQYKAFLDDAGGYMYPKHWKGLERAAEAGQQYRRCFNHAAENVSWWDATAFCRWLSDRLGFDVCLPHESEWQAAAMCGPRQHSYPWGADWDDGRANTWESRLGRTIAVGMYPHGKSPQGALDLCGNVWEWCSNPFDDPSERHAAGDVRRAVRGGSWSLSQPLARASSRSSSHPDARNYHIGFRVVSLSRHLSSLESSGSL